MLIGWKSGLLSAHLMKDIGHSIASTTTAHPMSIVLVAGIILGSLTMAIPPNRKKDDFKIGLGSKTPFKTKVRLYIRNKLEEFHNTPIQTKQHAVGVTLALAALVYVMSWLASTIDQRTVLPFLGVVGLILVVNRINAAMLDHQRRVNYVTKLSNLDIFQDRLRAMFYRAEGDSSKPGLNRRAPLMLIQMDMTGLKAFNEIVSRDPNTQKQVSGSNEYGNEALRNTAHVLRDAVKSWGVDAQAFHTGGDEFAILARIQNVPKALELLGRLYEDPRIKPLLLKDPRDPNKKTLAGTIRMGIAMSRRPGQTRENLLREADIALRISKSMGKSMGDSPTLTNNIDTITVYPFIFQEGREDIDAQRVAHRVLIELGDSLSPEIKELTINSVREASASRRQSIHQMPEYLGTISDTALAVEEFLAHKNPPSPEELLNLLSLLQHTEAEPIQSTRPTAAARMTEQQLFYQAHRMSAPEQKYDAIRALADAMVAKEMDPAPVMNTIDLLIKRLNGKLSIQSAERVLNKALEKSHAMVLQGIDPTPGFRNALHALDSTTLAGVLQVIDQADKDQRSALLWLENIVPTLAGAFLLAYQGHNSLLTAWSAVVAAIITHELGHWLFTPSKKDSLSITREGIFIHTGGLPLAEAMGPGLGLVSGVALLLTGIPPLVGTVFIILNGLSLISTQKWTGRSSDGDRLGLPQALGALASAA